MGWRSVHSCYASRGLMSGQWYELVGQWGRCQRGHRRLCKPDMVYVLDRGHGLHFYSLSFPCQPLAGVILLVR